jgi:hypothetical protein
LTYAISSLFYDFLIYFLILGLSPNELIDDKDSRGPGFKDSSERLKNYKELKAWQKSYQLCLEVYRITAGFLKNTIALIKSLEEKRLNP